MVSETLQAIQRPLQENSRAVIKPWSRLNTSGCLRRWLCINYVLMHAKYSVSRMQRGKALLGTKAVSTHWDATHATDAHVHGELSQAFAAQLLLDRLQAGLRASLVSVAASNLHYLRGALRATAKD
jgi:hypothetical protein